MTNRKWKMGSSLSLMLEDSVDQSQIKPTSPKRREFLDYLLGTSIGATLLAIFYPIARFLIPPQVTESAQNSVVAGSTKEIAANSGKIFKFGNKPGILIRTASGELKAFSATCTHLDCIVQYRPDD